MLKLWGRASSVNVQKALWIIGEIGVPFEHTEVGGPFGGLDTPEFGRMNPNRKVPVLDDNGYILWESNSIVRYLSAQYASGKLWPTDARERGLVDRWTDWQATELQPAMGPMFAGLIRTPPEKRDHAKIEASLKATNALCLTLEAALQGRDYLGGDHFTYADAVVGCAVHRWLTMQIERPATPALSAWHKRIKARPAAQPIVTQELK
jgi:glutathione S-transferase